MKRLASLLLVAILVVTMVPASLLSAFALETTIVSIDAPEKVTYTGDSSADTFQAALNLELADGLTAIAGYEIVLSWDATALTIAGDGTLYGEGSVQINNENAESGSIEIVVSNATDVLSGTLFVAEFYPVTDSVDAVISVEVQSMATASGLIAAEGDSTTVTIEAASAGNLTTTSLIPSGIDPMDHNFQAWGSNSTVMTMEEVDGSFIFKTDVAGWPSIDVIYEPLTFDIANSKLVYDFSVVNKGETKIGLYYTNNAGERKLHYLSNNMLPEGSYASGSGNNPVGTYAGEISLEDLLATVDYSGHTMSDAAVDGKVSFVGFQIFVVSGAEIVVDALEIVEVVEETVENFKASVDVNANAALTDDVTDITDSWASGVPAGKVVNVMNGNCQNVGMDVTITYALGETKTINGVDVYFFVDSGSMIGYPEGQATVLVSTDGVEYTSVGTFDLAAVDYSAPSTVKNAFSFDAVEAAYVQVLVYAGSNEAVRGDAAWDGKVNWEFISLTEVDVNVIIPNFKASVDVNANAALTDDVTDITDSWASGVPYGKVVNVMNGNCQNVGMDVTITYALGETKTINGVDVYFFVDSSSMIGYPEGQATVLVSTDGIEYTSVGTFDLAAVDYSAPSTVKNAFSFDAVEAAYVQVLVYAGSNEAVRGDAAWDGKVNWEFISLTEVDVNEAPATPDTPAIQPDELVELPEGAYMIDYAGYKHAFVHSIVAGDGMTVSELTALGNNGAAKDMNYAYIIVVDATGTVIQTWYELAVSKADVVCPEGGYIISYNGNKSTYTDLANVKVGATVTLYNINLDELRGEEGNFELIDAGFTFENPVTEEVTVDVNANAALTDDVTDITDSWGSGVPAGKVVNVMNPNCKYVGMNVTINYALGETKTIDTVDVYFYVDSGSMIGYPEGKATVLVSTDGVEYTSVGTFDLAAVDYSAPSTVKNTFTFEAVDAAYVRVVVYAGSNEEVRGDAAWDGKVNWEFISLTEVDVSEAQVPEFLRGDVDGDGVVHTRDYMMLKRHILQLYTMTDEEMARADVNLDGIVDARDYIVLKSVILGRYSFD